MTKPVDPTTYESRFDFDPLLDPDFEDVDPTPDHVGDFDHGVVDHRDHRDVSPDSLGSVGGAGRIVKNTGLVLAAGLCIWVVVTALSPTTLIDTTTAPNGAATSASGAISDQAGGDDGQVAGQTLDASGTVPPNGVVGAVGDETAGEIGATDGEAMADADGNGEGEAVGATTSSTVASDAGGSASLDYQSNLDMLLAASVRNRNHDNSPYLYTASASLVPENHYGPRSEYLGNPGGNPEQSFPTGAGGQFRAGCEFSHFSYDDPLVFPGKPGASHLHMHFGNTHVNAFSTYESLLNSGSSTCNGQELNRTGYWVPAMFDGQGNVRIPERIVVYYKGEGQARGGSGVFPERAAMIANDNLNTMPSAQGGVGGKKLTFQCSDNFSGVNGQGAQTLPDCAGSKFSQGGRWTVLEMNVKFPQCWNGQDAGNWENWTPPQGDWYGSRCSGQTFPNVEYFVNYKVDPGENTNNWFLSSDVDATSFGAAKATGGSTTHGDWWGAWHKPTNQMWLDNCVNFKGAAASGCGFGYLSDGGPNGGSPAAGPALKYRPQYDGPHKVKAETLMQELCGDTSRTYSKPEDAAYCAPGTGL